MNPENRQFLIIISANRLLQILFWNTKEKDILQEKKIWKFFLFSFFYSGTDSYTNNSGDVRFDRLQSSISDQTVNLMLAGISFYYNITYNKTIFHVELISI